LGNGFKLEKGEINFDSGLTGKSLLDARLRTASSTINLRIEIGSKLAGVIKSYESVPFVLKIDDTQISAPDLRAFLPGRKEFSSGMIGENSSLRIDCNASGTADLLNIGNLTLNTSAGLTFSASGQLKGITKPSSAVCSVEFRADNITSTRLTELIQLSGSTVKLPDFNTLALTGHISDSLTSPRFFVALRTPSDSIAINGSANIPEKKYSLVLTGRARSWVNLREQRPGHFWYHPS
jgi:hypothetical protein